MEYPLNFGTLTEDVDFYDELLKMHKLASSYLDSFDWCKSVDDSKVFLNLGSTLCIFLFEIENTASEEDNFLWVIVGDLPAMYLDIYGTKTTIEALKRYSTLAMDWIFNVESGQSIDECYPFDTSPTIEMAHLLKKRVVFIEKSIIPNIEEIRLPSPLDGV